MPADRPTLYFDLGSPYAYMAVERAGRVLRTDPELEPILLGAFFPRRGFGSWAHTAERDRRIEEIEERACRYGLPPFVWPEGWPVNGLAAMRAATWAKARGAVEPFALAVFRAQFGAGADISHVDVLASCAGQVGLDATEMRAALESAEIKQRLREATDAAWALGVRGVPTLEIDGVLIFGDDRLDAAIAPTDG